MINLNHTIEEINIMLHALSKLPYEVVHELVAKVKGQAEPQVQQIQTQVQASTPAPEATPTEGQPQ
jgi:hypothetical protein